MAHGLGGVCSEIGMASFPLYCTKENSYSFHLEDSIGRISNVLWLSFIYDMIFFVVMGMTSKLSTMFSKHLLNMGSKNRLCVNFLEY